MALVTIDFFSKSLMRTVTINAVVPVDKMSFSEETAESKGPFKTLYLLHGIFGNYTDWVSGTRIQRWAMDRNLAVVMPSGDNHFYVDCEATGEMYGKFIGEELVQTTRNIFPLSHERKDTFIAGLSMGGYGAVINGLKYHDTFGYVASLSGGFILDKVIQSDNSAPIPTGRRSYYECIFGDLDKLIGSDKDYKALITKLKDKKQAIPKMFMACGVNDFLLQQNRDYRDFLKKNDVDVTYIEAPGAHEWDFWDTHIQDVLDWLPLDAAAEGISSGNVKPRK